MQMQHQGAKKSAYGLYLQVTEIRQGREDQVQGGGFTGTSLMVWSRAVRQVGEFGGMADKEDLQGQS